MEEFEYDVCCADEDDRMSVLAAELAQQSGSLAAPPGISRQQLINRYSLWDFNLYSFGSQQGYVISQTSVNSLLFGGTGERSNRFHRK